jgi:hypothetical protein
MQKCRKNLLVAAGLGVLGFFAIFAGYAAFRRGEITHASPAPDLLSALPPGAPSIVYIDLLAVRSSSFYQHRPDKGPIAMPNKNYADFVQSTGFDFEKDLDRVVIASWPGVFSAEKKGTIAIADGRFDLARIRGYAMQKGKVEHQNGHEVFVFPSNAPTSPGGSNSVTLLDDHRVAIVEGPSIGPLFAAGGGTAGNDSAIERATRLDGAAIFAISRMPPLPDKFSPGGIQSTQFLNLARSIQWITLAARPEGDNLRISLEGECTSASDARQLQSSLEVLRMFGAAALDGPKAHQSMDPGSFTVMETLLKSAEVTSSAERVRILIELTPDIFKLGGARKTH